MGKAGDGMTKWIKSVKKFLVIAMALVLATPAFSYDDRNAHTINANGSFAGDGADEPSHSSNLGTVL
jgi:hypothetical protein